MHKLTRLFLPVLHTFPWKLHYIRHFPESRKINTKLLPTPEDLLPSTIAISTGYYFLRQVPSIVKWCEGDNNFIEHITYGDLYKYGSEYVAAAKKFTGAVEEHMCALTCVIIAAGAVAL
jgi:hypothetical protein